MSGPGGRSTATAGVLVLAIVAAVGALALGLAGAERSREVSVGRRAVDDQRVLALASVGVALDLERAVVSTADAARNATGPGVVLPPGFVAADPAMALTSAPLLSAADRADKDIAAALDRARDTGAAVVSPPVEFGKGPRTLLVAAAYQRDPVVGRPQTTVARRERIIGWTVVAVDLGEVLRANLSDGAVGAISDGALTRSATAASVPERLPRRTVDTNGRQLVIQAGSPTAVGVPGS
ncbi:MAG: CHASE domain-containing protein, partial [Acidimicrobiales bacterium]